ncbi:MAG: ABC transporter permease [Bacteroidales bacterium]|nr:ABC transporter permease [Bacteroidales bacterium]
MLALRIALRYLFSRKSHSAINLITLVAACGVGVITAAMICMLSVYNGFEGLVSDLTSRFDPDLRIQPVLGKTFHDSEELRQQLLAHPDVVAINTTLEETVLLSYSGHQIPATMKGVDNTFAQVTQIDSILLGDEGFLLKDEVADYCILGAGLASIIGTNRGFVRPLTVFCPRLIGEKGYANPDRLNTQDSTPQNHKTSPLTVDALSLAGADESFAEANLYCSNIFMVQQADYDNQYFLCSLPVARQLLGDSLLTSAYELRLRKGANADRVKKELTALLSNLSNLSNPSTSSLTILTQYQQQADAYRIMQIEKWLTFLLVFFILLIASFNAIGALSMLIIDKEPQITTLRNMGADDTLIRRIFTCEGWLITGLGAIAGLILGIVLCLLQQHFGFITLGGGDTTRYVVASYPVLLHWSDALLTLAAVATVGLLSTYYTVRSTL